MPVVKVGADYSHARPTREQLKKHGIEFVCRYILDDARNGGKALKAPELEFLRQCGCEVAFNFEYATHPVLTAAQGAADARTSLAELKKMHVPRSIVYFSFDYDVPASDYAGVLKYIRGAESVLGAGNAGAYGHYGIVEYLAGAGVKYLWQTYAWSRGRWSSHALVRQVKNGAFPGEFDGDLNHAYVADFGQWNMGDDDMAQFTDEHAEILENIGRIIYEGKRKNEPQTAGGGIPIAYLPRKLDEIIAALALLLREVDGSEELLAQLTVLVSSIQAGDPAAIVAALKEALPGPVAKAVAREFSADLAE